MSTSVTLITELIRPTIEALGLELWGVEHLIQGKYSVLRVYIDKSDDGVTIDDCEKVSRQVSGIFDVEDPIPGEYTLEVSSPGMERPLFTIEQFVSYVGSEVAVRLRSPLAGRRKFKGAIARVDADSVTLLVDGQEYTLPALSIDKANLIFE